MGLQLLISGERHLGIITHLLFSKKQLGMDWDGNLDL